MLTLYTRQNERLIPTQHAPATAKESACDTTWFDIVGPTQDEDRFVERCLEVSIPTREEMEEIESSSRLYSEDGAKFMTMTAITDLDTDEPSRTPVTFVLKHSKLVTVRYADPRPFRTFATNAPKPNPAYA